MKKSVLKYLFWAAVAVVLVYFCVRSIDWALFMEALGECRWIWVLASMLLGVLVQVVRALRWQMLLRPLDPTVSFVTCFNAYNICMVVNLAVPRAGDLARMGYVARDSSAGADKTLGTIVVERLCSLTIFESSAKRITNSVIAEQIYPIMTPQMISIDMRLTL